SWRGDAARWSAPTDWVLRLLARAGPAAIVLQNPKAATSRRTPKVARERDEGGSREPGPISCRCPRRRCVRRRGSARLAAGPENCDDPIFCPPVRADLGRQPDTP